MDIQSIPVLKSNLMELGDTFIPPMSTLDIPSTVIIEKMNDNFMILEKVSKYGNIQLSYTVKVEELM